MTQMKLETCIIVWKHHLAITHVDDQTRALVYDTIKYLEELKKLKGE